MGLTLSETQFLSVSASGLGLNEAACRAEGVEEQVAWLLAAGEEGRGRARDCSGPRHTPGLSL